MKQNLYSVTDILNSIIEEFELNSVGDDYKNTYKTKLYRALEQTGIKDEAIVKEIGKKKVRYYTGQQRQRLLASEELHDYLIDHSTSDVIKSRKRYKEIQEEIEHRRNEYIAFLDSQQEYYDDSIPYVSQKEYTSYKNTMMLTAIFETFFTPINDSLLLNDLSNILLKGDISLTPEDIDSEHRLAHPEGSYYKKRVSKENESKENESKENESKKNESKKNESKKNKSAK